MLRERGRCAGACYATLGGSSMFPGDATLETQRQFAGGGTRAYAIDLWYLTVTKHK